MYHEFSVLFTNFFPQKKKSSFYELGCMACFYAAVVCETLDLTDDW